MIPKVPPPNTQLLGAMVDGYVVAEWCPTKDGTGDPSAVAIAFNLRAVGDEATAFTGARSTPAWREWSAETFVQALDHDIANSGFDSDFHAMLWADAVVLVLPCGRSAHLELGWAAGRGLSTYVLFDDGKFEPELMYKMCSFFCLDVPSLLDTLELEEDALRESYDDNQLTAGGEA